MLYIFVSRFNSPMKVALLNLQQRYQRSNCLSALSFADL